MNERVKIDVPDEAMMTVIYDGECPFCSNFVRFMELQRRLGSVTLIDARSGDPLVARVQRAGYDLNEGMMAIYGGTTYYGSDALSLISALSSKQGVGQRMMGKLLGNPKRAKLLYPSMKFGRRIVLRMLGRPDIPPALD